MNQRKKETAEQALEKAVKQMEEKKYAAEREAAGVKKNPETGPCFSG
ncbi:MAG: hypothetical protein V2I97_03790 [Desulfococcaceae bacterium]|nr:hypothetical protein [Desulfococcaceae bacterium]